MLKIDFFSQIQTWTKLLEKMLSIMRTTQRNKTISKSTALRKENPLPQFKVASYKCLEIRLSFEDPTTLLSGGGGREESVGYEV